MKFLRDRLFLANSLNHLGVDIFNAQKTMILTFMVGILNIGNTEIGVYSTIMQVTAALTQPFFGWLTDRKKYYWLAPFGLLWMVGFYVVAVYLANWWTIWLMIIASLGSAMFHPVATERATTRARQLAIGGVTTASATFFLFGQMGFSIGPVVGGQLLDGFGLVGIWALALFALPVAGFSFYQNYQFRNLHSADVVGVDNGKSKKSLTREEIFVAGRWVIPAFGMLIFLRTMPAHIGMVFLPKLMADQGMTAGWQGFITAFFMGGAAIGGILGGMLADRFGYRNALIWTMLLAVPFVWLYPVMTGLWLPITIFIAGAAIGASHPMLVVMAQSIFPKSMAMASGLVLGFIFASGSLGGVLGGYFADQYELAWVMQQFVWGLVISILLTFLVAKRQPVS